MRKMLSAAGVLLLAIGTGSALAADLPSEKGPPTYTPPPPPPPAFSYNGFYIGANGGYAWSDRDNNNTYGILGYNGYGRNHEDGFAAGLQIGYDWELGSLGGFGGGNNGGFVIGFVADADYTDLKNDQTAYDGPYTADSHARLDFVGTARGRIGYAFDRFLIYGTGGFAYGGTHFEEQVYGPGGAYYDGSKSHWATGYVYGGGVEYALPTDSFINFFHAGAVTIGAEYLRYDLGSNSIYLDSNRNNGNYYNRYRSSGNLVEGTLNYHFDFTPTPAAVVSKY